MAPTEHGLSGLEAARRLATYGPNEPVPVRRLPAVVQLCQLFANARNQGPPIRDALVAAYAPIARRS